MFANIIKKASIAGAASLVLTSPLFAAPAKEVHVAVTTFLSGPGAVFGVPARDAATMIIDEINAKGGLKGAAVKLVFLDEAMGLESLTAEFKRLGQSGEIDFAIAGLSSSTCLSLAPVAEELKLPTILWDCGTSRIFEDKKYQFVFRTSDYTPQTNVAAALYLLKNRPDVKTIAGINPDYAFGRDNWEAFKTAMSKLKPDVQVVAELFPKLGSTDFSTEISRLSALRADVLFSTLWGGDMNTFLRQAGTRNLFRTSQLVSPVGESALEQLGPAFPKGSIVGARGDSWAFNPAKADDPEHQAFVSNFKAKTGAYPIFPAYHMAQAVSAVQLALDKSWNGEDDALHTSLVAGLNEIEVSNFTGSLKLRPDHQAVEGQLYGTTTGFEDGKPTMEKVATIPGNLVTPPLGSTSLDWIKALQPQVLDTVTLSSK